MRIVLVASLICFGCASFVLAADSSYLNVIKAKGANIEKDGTAYLYKQPFQKEVKKNGPLAGKTIALVVASDFSDWQAYYFVSYIGEFGGKVQFVMDNNHLWKCPTPMIGIPTEPLGMWGLSLSGGFNGQGMNGGRALFPAVMKPGAGLAKDYPVAKPEDYDAMIILGDNSGDVLYPDDVAQKFIKAVADREVPVAAIGGGILPLIKLKIVNGKNVTGGASVRLHAEKGCALHGQFLRCDRRQAHHRPEYHRLTCCPEGIVQGLRPEICRYGQRHSQGQKNFGYGN